MAFAAAAKAPSGGIVAIGAALLGVFIGYMAWYFIVRFASDKYTSDGLVAVAGVVAGGAVIQFMKGNVGARDWWWYPVGLVIGWVLFVLFHLINWLVTRSKGPLPLPAIIAPQKKDDPLPARRQS
jgi:hypothetical protein